MVIFFLNFFVNHRWFHQNWWIIHHFQYHLSDRLNYCLSLWKFYRKYLQFIQIFTNFGEPSSTSIFACTKKIGQHRYCHQIWWFLFLLEIHGKWPQSPFINLFLQMQKSGNFSDGMVQWWRSGGESSVNSNHELCENPTMIYEPDYTVRYNILFWFRACILW